MLVLAIETATGVESVSLNIERRVLSGLDLDDGLNHSSSLMKNIAQVLITAGKKISEVDAIAVSAGPGSFTGLRTGFSLAKGLAYAAKKPFIPVPTLDALAWSYSSAEKGIIAGRLVATKGKTLLCPALDARRSEFYFSVYVRKDETLVKLLADSSLSLKDMCTVLAGFKAEEVVFLGDGVKGSMEEIKKLLKKASFAGTLPGASGVGGLALLELYNGTVPDFNKAFPSYVRKPDAVINKEKGKKV